MTQSKSVKFEISLKELKVTFEGDIQTAERMQGQITGAINSLTSAQQRLLSAGQGTAPVATVVEPAVVVPRRRRRRRGAGTSGLDSALSGADGTDSSEEDVVESPRARVTRRAGTGDNLPGLLAQMKNEGYFAEERTTGHVRDELSKRGQNYRSNEISTALLNLTQQQQLRREKVPGKNQWKYQAR